MPRSKISYLIITAGVVLAVIPVVVWYLLPGPFTMAGDIVLQNGTQQNIWERPFGRLILIASCFSVISAIAVAFIYERLKTKSLKSDS